MSQNHKSFFDYDPNELNFVPFDIETTGFKSCEGDFVTTIVLYNDTQYHIWINTEGDTDVDIEEMYSEIEEVSGLDNFVIYICNSERMMFQNIEEYINAHTDPSTVLTAFNGETFKGNTDFDVPFLRTRCVNNGVPFMFKNHWYTDSYEIFSQSNRFDTKVKDEPSLEGMKKADLIQFVEDTDSIDVHYANMKKAEVVNAIENHSGVNESILESWVENNNIVGVDPSNPSSFNKGELESFIDSNSLDIPYDKLSKDELVKAIRNQNYSEDMLVEWHNETGRDIGNTEIGDLDGIHRVMLEDKIHDENWRESIPFDVEVFEPFDPYEESGEAVTGYMDGDYTGVILHCFADVARTVNITNMMAEYAPQSDYKPKVL